MLSLDLFDSKYEKQLREGATDNVELRSIQHLLEPLSKEAAEILTRIRAGKLSNNEKSELRKRYDDLVKRRQDIIFNRPTTEQQQPVTPPAKGLLKGKDLVTPQQRVAGATPQKPGMTGAVKDVVGGVKRWLKGEPDQGPTYEEQQQSPRAYGVANFQRLVKANMGNYPKVEFEFANAKENINLDKHGIDLISDYYDGLENDQAKNFFIYRVLPSAAETRKVLKSIGWQEQVQQPLPGIPTQGELPLSEADQKKKSNQDNLNAGDVKTAREIEKIRAKYPAARSDIEALARAEIDSTERSQEQIGRIRSSNSRQDELLKQIMSIDREQSKEINTLDNEKDSIEAQLDRVQSLNDRLTQTVSQMSGNKVASKARTERPGAIDLIPGAPADRAQTPAATPTPKPTVARTPAVTPAPAPEPSTSPALDNVVRTIQALPTDAPDTAKEPEKLDNEPEEKPIGSLKSLRSQQAANVDDFKLVAEGRMKQALDDYKLSTDDDFYKKYRMTKKDFYQTVVNPKKAKFSATRACPQCGKERESCVCESTVEEAKEIRTQQDYYAAIDKIDREMAKETNPAILQIKRIERNVLMQRARAEGWIPNKVVQEESSTSSDEAEIAILKRIMVSHLDLLKEYGPKKVMQAVEEVAYNVGDLPEIGSSDVSGWVDQVKQILGADA